MNAGEIKRLSVVGAGLMGHGIAQEFAVAGYDVCLHSRRVESLDRALSSIDSNLERLVSLEVVTREQAFAALARISATTDFDEAVDDIDFVVESVFEDLALKQQILEKLDRQCPERTILASNTSSLMPSALASGVARSDRLLVAHYINPPFLIPLVEIVPSDATSDETVQTVCDLLTGMKKRPIIVRKETPGFVLNHLQGALLREALWLVENGVASARDVDIAIKSSIGRRWAVAGIFEVFDIAGWDIVSSIASSVLPHLASTTEVSPILREKVERGELGMKTGKGFYEWTPETADALRQRIANALIEIERWSGRND